MNTVMYLYLRVRTVGNDPKNNKTIGDDGHSFCFTGTVAL